MFPTRRTYVVPLADHHELRLGERPLVMGILNVTPDSFADASPIVDSTAAIDRAIEMEEEGADILDVGGESTRPGTEPGTATEELSRVLPVVRALARRVRVPISVDTYRAEVARAVIAEGATIINDISGLRYEPQLADVAAESPVALVLMHMRGRPKAMYEEAVYADLMAEVIAELRASMTVASAAGNVAMPSRSTLKYSMVPPTSSGMRPRALICAINIRASWDMASAGRGSRPAMRRLRAMNSRLMESGDSAGSQKATP